MLAKTQDDDGALVILPGLLCDSRLFADQLGAFPGAIVIDGFYEGARTLQEMAEYALARMPARVSLVGHSMGARVALEVIRRAPGRVERLALASTGVHPVSDAEPAARMALLRLGQEQGMAALVDRWLPPMLSPVTQQDSALVERLRAMAISARVETYQRQIEALLARPSTDDVLAAIRCPVMAIVGERDAWSPPEQHAAFVTKIPGAALRIIPGAGHMLPAERPAEFNAALCEWLAMPASQGATPVT